MFLDGEKMKKLTDKHPKLFFVMLIAIICLLIIGIVYQFVHIKHLEKRIEEASSSQIQLFEEEKSVKVTKNI